MPTYSPNIPQPGDQPSQSQNQILENFQVANTAFAQDHAPYNSPIQGQHEQITFPVGPLAGQPFTFLAGQIGLQNVTAAPTAIPDIWMSRGAATAFPITGYGLGGVNASNGWTYLPSGIKMVWGIDTIPTSSVLPRVIIFATQVPSFPGFPTVLGNISLTRYQTGAPATTTNFGVVSSFSNEQFTYYGSTLSTNVSYFWSAIGF